ncbi:MAG: prepilin peptidase [Patescibacteria group bacterium]
MLDFINAKMLAIYFLTLYLTVQGAVVGSFLNVLVDRLPRGKSLLGRSKCDGCNRTLSPYELVPIFSYFFLGGKSYCCKKKLSIRYSLVEGITAIVFYFVSLWYLSSVGVEKIFEPITWIGLFALLLMSSISIAMALIDFDLQILPDSLQLIFFTSVLMWLFAQSAFTISIIGEAAVVAMPILLLYLGTKSRGMGYGDIKLAFTLGIWLGLVKGLLGIYFGFITGAIYGVILLMTHKAKRKSHMAFGPFLLLGAWIAFLIGDKILRLFGF